MKIPLDGTLRSLYPTTTIGHTIYDYQQNCAMGRQVEHRGTDYVHFGWLSDGLAYPAYPGIAYQAYEISSCEEVFVADGIRIEASTAGFVSMDAHTVWAIVAAHQNEEPFHSKAYWDFMAGGPVFGVFTSDASSDNYGWYQNPGTGLGNENLWPKIEWDIDGVEQVLHMVACEYNTDKGPLSASYYRRVGPYGAGLGIWSDQRVIDTIMNISPTVASSPISDRIAIVWTAPADYKRDLPNEFSNQLENDIWFAISTDNGSGWAATSTAEGAPSIGHTVDLGNGVGYVSNLGGNLTTYVPQAEYKAYCDVSALFSVMDNPNDYLQIVWNCRRWVGTTVVYRRQSAIYHWTEKNPTIIREIVKADWDTGGRGYPHAFGGDAGKMTISECDNKLYVLFTQFGKPSKPDGFKDIEKFVVNGYLYMSVYDPIYNNWDRPQRVTDNPEIDDCIPGNLSGPGNCNSEYWASMSRYGRFDTCKIFPPDNVLDIIYINDYAPGSCVQTESGVWTTNPVNWVVYPCREAIPEAEYEDDAEAGFGISYGEVVLVLPPTGDTTITLAIVNWGSLANNFTAGISHDSGGSGNSSFQIIPPSGVILPGDSTFIDLTIETNGEDDFCGVYATLTITHDGDPGIRIIPVNVIVASEFTWPEQKLLETVNADIKIANNGKLQDGTPYQSFDLYAGGPILSYQDGPEYKCYHTYDNRFGDPNGMMPLSEMITDDYGDFKVAISAFCTADSLYQIVNEYYTSTNPDYGDFVYVRSSISSMTNEFTPPVYFGALIDADLPAQGGYDNTSYVDGGNRFIYQQGTDTTADKTTGVLFDDSVNVYGARTINSDSTIKLNTSLDAQMMFNLMSAGGFEAYTGGPADLSMLITFPQTTCEPGEDSIRLGKLYRGAGPSTVFGMALAKHDGRQDWQDVWDKFMEWWASQFGIIPNMYAELPLWEFHFDGAGLSANDGILMMWSGFNDIPVGIPVFVGPVFNQDSVEDEIPVYANMLIGEFYWDPYKSGPKVDKFKIAASMGSSGDWYLRNLLRYLALQDSVGLDLPAITDANNPDSFFYAVDLSVWDTSPWADSTPRDSYMVDDGRCDSLPGYLIDECGISFNSGNPDGPFVSSCPYTGIVRSSGLIRVDRNCPGCIPGDANGDGTVDVGDAVYIINYVFKGGPPPTPWTICSGDANGDCACNVGDAVYIISYVFKGGPPPVTREYFEANCLPIPGCGDYNPIIK